MAGKVRHLVNRKGRYHARLVVPKDLRGIVGKTELRSPLGGDYRQALKLLPGAVAQLQHQIALAEQKASAGRAQPGPARYPLATEQLAIAFTHSGWSLMMNYAMIRAGRLLELMIFWCNDCAPRLQAVQTTMN
ncbi:hypothetical protein SAMN04488077_103182 [Roseovarius tolerans]|uniref:DUF6538 domain-containing protein n=1 Tax=Roseovarius tolerans TaxID=74031 RepID=A0A1H7WW19_9RHOB|nr:DUF6538 domain-containing protein [Roseovarius tolerans]SEM25766.1 hypothetical protein SAMN04488077_103182 [Roseovarius tolerans]